MYTIYPRMRCVRSIIEPRRKSGSIGKLLGQGSFSAVYDAPGDEVFKLTKCRATVDFLMHSYQYVRQGERHLPKLLRFEGVIGTDPHEMTPLYGVWIEKLRRPTRDERQLQRVRRCVLDMIHRNGDTDDNLLRTAKGELLHGKMTFDPELLQSLHRLHKIFVRLGDVSIDLHRDNIMVRPKTGELVINDPFIMDSA